MPGKKGEVGKKALDLRHEWDAHANEHCASPNTVFAVFGISSKCRRIADNLGFNKTPYSTWLADIGFDVRVDDSEDRSPLKGPQSDAVQEIEKHGLIRSGGRKVPLRSRAQKALLHYYRERLEILTKIDAFLTETKPRERGRYLSQISKHKSAVAVIIGGVSALATCL